MDYKLQEFYMGSTQSAKPLDSAEQISTSENEGPQVLVQSCCMKNVIYIKKHFHDCLLPHQRKRLSNLEKVILELTQSCQNIGITAEDHKVLFRSVHEQLKLLKRQVENMWKKGYSDYEASLRKMQRQNVQKVDIFQIIEVAKCSHTPPSLIDLNNINFPILSYTNSNLAHLAGLVLKNTAFVVQQSIKSSRIDSFIDTIVLNYNVTGYHNFSHAFSVFLMTYQSFTLSAEMKQYINSQQLFFLLVACIAHDLGHKGKNNAYYVKKKSQYAVVYSNQGVLENMHLSRLFRVLDQNPHCDILSLKDAALKTRGRKIMMRCILATDMSTHFSSLKQFKERCDAAQQSMKDGNQRAKYLALQKEREPDRDLVMEMIIHACDIGNPCYQFKNYLNWAALLAQQFNEQHKKEVKYGFQPTPMLQYVDKPTFYRGQMGFCKNLVLPLWKQLSVFSPALKLFTEQVEENISSLELKL